MQMMAQIFGPLAGGGETLLSVTVGYFNIAILALGGLIFFYNVTAGVLQTAHEGEVLGKRWNSLWAPIRIICALGLMMPVPGLGGYNTIQTGVAWMVSGSTSLASLMWSAAVPAILLGKAQIATSSPTIPTSFIGEAWNVAACQVLANYQLKAAGSDARVTVASELRAGGQIAFLTKIVGLPDSVSVCGALATPALPTYLLTADNAVTRDAASKAFVEAHSAALAGLLENATALAQSTFEVSLSHYGPLPDIAPGLHEAILEANATLEPVFHLVTAVAADEGEGQQRLRDYLENDGGQGWLAAGSYYLVLARLNGEIASVLSAAPTVLSPARYIYEETGQTLDAVASGRWMGPLGNASAGNLRLNEEEVLRIAGDLERAFVRASASLSTLGFSLPDPALAAALSASHGEGGGIWDAISAAVDDLGRQLAQKVALHFSPTNFGSDLMVGLVSLGQFLVTAAAALVTALALASAIPIVGAGVTTAATVIGPLVLAMSVVGSVMSVLLPTIPFLMWVLGLFGYFVAVAAAIVATPIWALAHLRMDGEGIAPEGTHQGYLMLLRLFLTPPLMVIGFLAAMGIFRVVGGLIGIGIYYLLSSFSGSPLHWLAAAVVMTCMTAAIFLIVLERSFSLITTLPNAVLGWFGGAGHDDN